MSTNLVIFGQTYNDAAGIKAMDDNDNVRTFVLRASEETISDSGAVSEELEPGILYHFTGALTSLTITLATTTDIAEYHFDFLSGSTAPTLTLPNTVVMPDSFQVVASKRYEIDILNNYGVAQSWSTS